MLKLFPRKGWETQVKWSWSCCCTSSFCSCVSGSESDGGLCVCVSSPCLVPALHPHDADENDGKMSFLLPWIAERKIYKYIYIVVFSDRVIYSCQIGSWFSPISFTTSGSGPEKRGMKTNLKNDKKCAFLCYKYFVCFMSDSLSHFCESVLSNFNESVQDTALTICLSTGVFLWHFTPSKQV